MDADKGAKVFGIIIVILAIAFSRLETSTMVFILVYILLPIVGIVVILVSLIYLVKSLIERRKKQKENKGESNNK
jgi:hypothetical protein